MLLENPSGWEAVDMLPKKIKHSNDPEKPLLNHYFDTNLEMQWARHLSVRLHHPASPMQDVPHSAW